MKLEFTKEGLLPEDMLERIRGRPTKYGWEPPKSHGDYIDKPALDGQIYTGQDPEHYYVVNGFAPELMTGVAFRLTKHYRTQGKKELKCPHCGKIFCSIDQNVTVELRCYSRESNVPLHNFSWCKNCHTKVGVIHKSA
jgi:hypothetical protein